MGMPDPKELTQLFIDSLSNYLSWLVEFASQPSKIVSRARNSKKSPLKDPQLTTIILGSILIGITIGAIIPNRPPIAERATVFVVVCMLWLFVSLLVHGLCKLFRGKETIGVTVSLMIQVLAFAYVSSNLLTLFVISAARLFEPPMEVLVHSGDFLLTLYGCIYAPSLVLIPLQILVLLGYVPVTLAKAHGLRGILAILLTIGASLAAAGFGFTVTTVGGC